MSYVLDEVIEEEHYVRLIEEMAGRFHQANPGLFSDKGFGVTGRKAYHPAMLLGVWFYGYLNGVSSSRKLEQECRRNIELHWLCGRLVPDHKTFSDFRKTHGPAIQSFTKQFNALLKEAGYIQGRTVAVDGSKLRAYASESYTVATLADKLKDTDEKLTYYFERVDSYDQQEDQAELLKERRAGLLAEIEALEARRDELMSCQQAAERNPAKRISPTDAEARIMKGRQGKHYSYNLQSVVDSSSGMIATYQLTNHENDKGLLAPIIEQFSNEHQAPPEQALADAGYHDTEQIKGLEEQGINCYVAINDNQQALAQQQGLSFTYQAEQDQYRCSQGKTLVKKHGFKRDKRRGTLMQRYVGTACQGCSIKALCTKAAARSVYRHHDQPYRDAYRQKMESRAGKQRLRQRMALVEHPFGTLKDRMGHTPLLLRGLKKVTTEVSFYVMGYNFTRLTNLSSFQSIRKLIRHYDWKLISDLVIGIFNRLTASPAGPQLIYSAK